MKYYYVEFPVGCHACGACSVGLHLFMYHGHKRLVFLAACTIVICTLAARIKVQKGGQSLNLFHKTFARRRATFSNNNPYILKAQASGKVSAYQQLGRNGFCQLLKLAGIVGSNRP